MYIAQPETIGIETLSLILKEINSTIEATNAPKIKILISNISLNIKPIPRQEIKQAIEPDKVFFPILKKGYLIPIIAAKVSPTDKKNNAIIQNGLGTMIIENNDPTKTHVAPVRLPFFSKFLIIKNKYFLIENCTL